MTISRALRLVPAAVLVLGLAACTNDDAGAGEAEPSAGTSGATTGATSEATTTAPEAPSVEPATGEELSVQTVSMRLTDSPEWGVTPTPLTVVGSLVVDGGIVDVTVQDVPSAPGRTTEDKAVSYERTLSTDDPAPRRVANRVIDGVDCFVLDGRNDKKRNYVVGAVVKDRLFLLRFRVPAGLADGDQMIEQMLASVDIKGA